MRLLANNTDLIAPSSFFLFEDHLQASAKTEDDIYGRPVVILKELASSNASWTVGAAYLTLPTVQACIAAYENDVVLQLVDEFNTSVDVIISDYPIIERHKSMADVVYTVKLNLINKRTTLTPPPVLSTTGPRLFGR